tara:strand:- start:3345 stop:3725 length:381 start_codon:yes stop_codon:yes gene_type:complete
MNQKSYGTHVYVDYVNFFPNVDNCSSKVLEIILNCLEKMEIKVVHSHSEVFDGNESPPGFASIVLIDESHVTAHCYSEKGWLALDAFTCGDHDSKKLIDMINEKIVEMCQGLVIMKKEVVERFVHK